MRVNGSIKSVDRMPYLALLELSETNVPLLNFVTVQSSEEISLPLVQIGSKVRLECFIQFGVVTNTSPVEFDLFVTQMGKDATTKGRAKVISRVNDYEYVISPSNSVTITLELEEGVSLYDGQIIEFTGELSSET